MKWHSYLASFFSGVFFGNWIPHFVHGVNGDHFPNPFSILFGTTFDAPVVNILWAVINVCLGYVLLRAGKVAKDNIRTVIAFLLGFSALGVFLALAAPTVLAQYK